VDAIVANGRNTQDKPLELAAGHDPGFEQSWFAEALDAVDRLPDRLFQPYSMNAEDVGALKARMRAWALKIRAPD
jgi:hypothetical protein